MTPLTRFRPHPSRGAASLAWLLGATLLVLAATHTGGIVGVVAPLWTVLFATGLVLPNAPTLALARHGEAAGTASALLGATQMGVGAIVSPLVGVLGNDAVAMGAVMTGGAVVALAVLVSVVRPCPRTTAGTPG